jgi:ATP-binding cassette subfamily C (CFTR/MRP) protein 1
MLGSVKGVKLLGMTEKVYADIQSMKEVEIKKSEKFRQLLIAAAAIGESVTHSNCRVQVANRYTAYSNTALAPVISFAIYTIRANINNTETLTTAKAFTSLTLFALVNTPIGNLVESGAGLATAIGSLARINEFLLQKPRSDGRVRSTSITKAHISGSMDGEYTPSSMHSSIALYPMIRNQDETLVARNRSAGWGNEKPSTIVDMNFDIQPSTLTMIIGPVGCGKSTLLNALLGETPEYDGYLLVTTKDVAYCGQTPWLTNKTLQQNVIGESHFYPQWYSEVIRACALEQDIDELPNGDQSMLGSKGATLSGGQKQRIVSHNVDRVI